MGLTTLSAKITADISDFSKNLQKVAALASSTSRKMNGGINSDLLDASNQTRAWGLNLKSVSQVVSGIVISQAFYNILQSVRGATQAVWEFSTSLEYAKISYSNLFGDTELATEFINVLKDFAATTPFDFADSEAAAKRLLAYGIEYQNVMYVMQGVLASSSMTGDPAAIESVSRALGQIYTKGRLMNEEMRQLAEAGIPAYEILTEQLGLTQKELQNLGDQGIPASEAINALVDGMTERFGSVVEASSKTITGIGSNIRDNLMMLTSEAIQPLIMLIKSGMNEINEFLYTIQAVMGTSGIGGVFEELVPEELQSNVRQLAANFLLLMQSVLRLANEIRTAFAPVMVELMNVFNALTPIISSVLNGLSWLIGVISSNSTALNVLISMLTAAAAMWVVFKVRAIAAAAVSAVISGISRALAGLSAMLTFVVAHPFWALLIGLTGVVVGLAGGFSTLGDTVNGYFKSLTQFNGVDPDKLLLPSQEERASDLEKFNNALDGTSDAMDDLADSTGNATKAASGLLSFDEVFKLNEPDEGSGSGSLDDTSLDIPGLGGGLGDTFIPEIPDFSLFAENFVGAMLDDLKDELISAGIGATLGAILGGLIGGPLGAKIGAVAGGIAGFFWNELADYFGLTPEEKVKAGISAGIGTALGAIVGGIFGGAGGAKIGAAIGGLAGTIWGMLAQHLGVTDEQQIASSILAGIQGALTGIGKYISGFIGAQLVTETGEGAFSSVFVNLGASLKSSFKTGILGFLASLVSGLLSDGLVAWLADEFDLVDKDIENGSVGKTIGGIWGTITGLILAGPVGSIVGGSLGTFAGNVLGAFWDYMTNTLKGVVIGGAAGTPIGALIGTLVGSLAGPVGAAIGAAAGAALGALVGLVMDYWEEISSFFTTIGEGISTFFKSITDFISTHWETTSNSLAEGFSVVKETLGTVFGPLIDYVNETFEMLVNVVEDFLEPFSEVFSDIKKALDKFGSDLLKGAEKIFSDVFKAVSTVLTDLKNFAETVWNDIKTAFETVFTALNEIATSLFELLYEIFNWAFTGIKDFVTDTFESIKETVTTVLEDVYETVSTILTNVVETVSAVLMPVIGAVAFIFISVYNTISSWLSSAYEVVNTVVSNIYNTVRNWFSSIYTVIREKVEGAYSVINNAFWNAYDAIAGSISNMYSSVKNGVSNIYTEFKNFVDRLWNNVFGKLFGWVDGLIDGFTELFRQENKASSIKVSTSSISYNPLAGHASGGIFNREHIASFAEGNKAEAIIPLENNSAMQPFVDAVANGLTSVLAPILATNNSSTEHTPIYVGTLIADDRSLEELNRRMRVIQIQEDVRRG